MIPIQANPDPTEFLDGGAFDALLNQFVGGVMSEALFGTLIGVLVLVPLWIISDDLALPTVVTILMGGLVSAVLPGDYQQIALYIVVVGIASAIFESARRYFL